MSENGKFSLVEGRTLALQVVREMQKWRGKGEKNQIQSDFILEVNWKLLKGLH